MNSRILASAQRRKRALGVCLAVAVLSVVVFAGFAGAYPSGPLPLRTGLAWLESAAIGQLTLVDGTSAAAVSNVAVGPPGTYGYVTQVGTRAYFLNPVDGSVSKVEASRSTAAVAAAPHPERGDAILANQQTVFVLAWGTRHLMTWNAGTLGGAETRELPNPYQHMLGSDGRLWSLTLDGTVSWWDGGSERRSVGRAHVSSRAAMVLAGDTPVVIDPIRARIDVFSAGRRTAPIDVLPDDQGIRVWGSTGDRFYIWVRGRHILNVCSATTATCRQMPGIALADDNRSWLTVPADDGTVTEAWGKILLWMPGAGIAIVNPTSLAIERTVRLKGPFGQLAVRDGIVFLNNPYGPDAAVLRPDGRLIGFKKYAVGPGHRPTGQPTKSPRVLRSHGPSPTGDTRTILPISPTAESTAIRPGGNSPSPSPVPFTSPSGRQNRASPSPSVGTTGSPSPITQLTIAAIT
ncbi:hypothetical protein J5X84_44525, partial [Streptosporangiaceae bacterium NEAU-GS5]|nr:hypothetical protein [Streptosporangiaceae bacterium NEAU-GS5]